MTFIRLLRALVEPEWYSICSIHRYSEPAGTCGMCDTGEWVYPVPHFIDAMFYRLAPSLWRVWVNRPGSPSRARLERWFPNLTRRKGA